MAQKPAQNNSKISFSKLTPRERLDLLVPYVHLDIQLRDYQEECLRAITELPPGSRALIVMATGLGKTVVFSSIPTTKKVLILSNGREVVYNAIESYYNRDEVGVEMESFHAKRDFPNARIISASVASIKDRLDTYSPDEFDIVIVDEAHHAPAPSYMKVINFFKPRLLLGFTATPKRTDGVSLACAFDSICYQRDIMWGIRNGHLCDVYLRQVQIDVDLRNCHINADKNTGETDYVQSDLVKAFARSAPLIVDIYNQYKYGPTLIYVAGVNLALEVARLIPGAMPIVNNTPRDSRTEIIQQFKQGLIPCIVSVSTLTEGVNLPCCMTLIYCRPTLSNLVYTQIVGRGLRPYPGKTALNLIEIQGIVDPKITLCSCASLTGKDLSEVPKKDMETFDRHCLSEMDDMIDEIQNSARFQLLSANSTERWADASGYDLRGANWLMMPDSSFQMYLPVKNDTMQQRLYIPPMDALGRVRFGVVRMPVQNALDLYRQVLETKFPKERKLWDKEARRNSWGNDPLSERQANLIHRLMPDMDTSDMTKGEATMVITNIQAEQVRSGERTDYVPVYPIDPDAPPPFFGSTETIAEDGRTMTVYDYIPDPSVYVLDVKSAKLASEFLRYLKLCVMTVYYQSGKDIPAVVERINRSNKSDYPRAFFDSKLGARYRYVRALNGANISRKDLREWMAKIADAGIPRILDKLYVHPVDNPETANFAAGIVDLSVPPLSAYKPSFPETTEQLARKHSRLPKTAEEIKNEMYEKWAGDYTPPSKRNRKQKTNHPKS